MTHTTRIGRIEVVYDEEAFLDPTPAHIWKVRVYVEPPKPWRWDYWTYPDVDQDVSVWVARHRVRLAPPSDTLRALIEQFHHKRAVAPLVDKLCEEYSELAPALLAAYYSQPSGGHNS